MGLITIFSLVVLIVESVKSHYQASSDIVDKNLIGSYLFVMPLLCVGILCFMVIPKHQLFRLGYYATTLGLILLIN